VLAGNIVQVRLERKALSAAVSPTCCSGREQRSKTASAGSAIPIRMKAAIRKEMRSQRRALSAAEHRRRSMLAAKAVAGLPMFRAGKRIALYLPFDRETDTAALVAAARRRGVHIFVPVIVDRRHARIRFYPLDRRTRCGTFGISVPSRLTRPVPARWLNLIVIPLVGVDARGRRLGMGGGFYDRALEFRRRRGRWAGPRLVGLAFDCQRTESRFADTWDVSLDALATESGLLHYLKGTP
jgi:5-formyltetrahydrofolate cyclo-ligase